MGRAKVYCPSMPELNCVAPSGLKGRGDSGFQFPIFELCRLLRRLYPGASAWAFVMWDWRQCCGLGELRKSGTPLAALETLGMQVALSAQSIFDSRSAREWVKNFELPDEETPIEGNGGNGDKGDTKEAEKPKTGPLKQVKKTGPLGGTGPLGKTGPLPATSRLLTKMTDSGLLISHPGNRLRFLHPVLAGYLAGRSLADINMDEALLEQPDWSGKLLAMRYIAAHGDASGLVNVMLAQTKMPLHRPLFMTARWLRDAPREATWRKKVFPRKKLSRCLLYRLF